MAHLRVETGEEAGATFEVPEGGRIVIGRLEACEVRLRGDDDVSRRHAQVRWKEGGYVLTDLGSRNGTRLNGEPVETAALTDGDRIEVGASRVRFVEASPEPAPALPPWARPAAEMCLYLALLVVVFLIASHAAYIVGRLIQAAP